jgi:hypothetical protein
MSLFFVTIICDDASHRDKVVTVGRLVDLPDGTVAELDVHGRKVDEASYWSNPRDEHLADPGGDYARARIRLRCRHHRRPDVQLTQERARRLIDGLRDAGRSTVLLSDLAATV